MDCTTCGKQVARTARYCPYCGSLARTTPAPAKASRQNHGVSLIAVGVLTILCSILAVGGTGIWLAVRAAGEIPLRTVQTGAPPPTATLSIQATSTQTRSQSEIAEDSDKSTRASSAAPTDISRTPAIIQRLTTTARPTAVSSVTIPLVTPDPAT